MQFSFFFWVKNISFLIKKKELIFVLLTNKIYNKKEILVNATTCGYRLVREYKRLVHEFFNFLVLIMWKVLDDKHILLLD